MPAIAVIEKMSATLGTKNLKELRILFPPHRTITGFSLIQRAVDDL
jgi:hypothetical protein